MFVTLPAMELILDGLIRVEPSERFADRGQAEP